MTLVAEPKIEISKAVKLEEISVPGYERVVKVSHRESGLVGIICIHNMTMGPALGGTRIYPYKTFDDALNDVKRLAKGMTYKSCVAGTGLGGGKSVIIADSRTQKTPELLYAFGQAVNALGGTYICAEDIGATTDDMTTINKATPYVVGLPHEKSSGDPSPFTAWGTLLGIKACLKKIYGDTSVAGRKIAVQGLGAVGSRLAELLFWEGADLIVSDIDSQRLEKIANKLSAKIVPPEGILSTQCDVVSPCAMGGIINEHSISELRCKAIAGSANNQLLKDSDADILVQKGILYAPDFVINAGGLINVTEELSKEGYRSVEARRKVEKLSEELAFIFQIAESNQCSTHSAAISLVDYHLKYRVGVRTAPLYFHHSDHIL